MKNILTTIIVLLFATSVYAATNDVTVGGTTGYPPNGAGTVLLQRTIDFSASSLTGTSNDIYNVIAIPAGTYITAVGYVIEENSKGITGEDSVCTIDIGDTDSYDGLVNGANVLTGQVATAYIDLVTTGKLYKAQSYIAVTLKNPADTLKMTVRAFGYPVKGY